MSFDCSRFPFDPRNDYLGVVMQQGRVQLDSDWNEWQAELARRIQAGTLDILGRAAYPSANPKAFKIQVSVAPSSEIARLTIGRGRMYVDGLLAENHGITPPAFTVVAASNLSNAGSYSVQISLCNGGFSLALQAMGAAAPVKTLWSLALSAVQNAVNTDPVLSTYIQVQSVSTLTACLPATGSYNLVPYESGYRAEIPMESSAPCWDSALAEMLGAAEIDYIQQPYLPGPCAPFETASPPNGQFLVYLDVWRRAVTYLEDDNLIDKAVGIDTTGRLQTVWQVKLLPLEGSSGPVDCCALDTDLPSKWQDLLQPPAALLTTGTAPIANSGPCCLTSNAGYTGLENQLYRVEIHRSGTQPGAANASSPPTGPTFKWSRDNGSVTTSVSAIAPYTNSANNVVSQLSVQSLGRDNMLCFSPGDWIEITDDFRELRGQPGELCQIAAMGVDKVSKQIVLTSALSGEFQERIASPPANYPDCHTRITRWNQGGKVFEADGQTLWVDLNTQTQGFPPGEIPVPPPGVSLMLDNGIIISFNSNSNSTGCFESGSFWTFAARSVDGSVETLNQAPPQGIHHHYARLAVVSFVPEAMLDCRTPWPPQTCCQPEKVTVESDLGSLEDIIGPCGTPDDGFKIKIAGNLEQHGSPPALWNPPPPLSPPQVSNPYDFLVSPGTMFLGGQRTVFPARSPGQSGRFWYSYVDQPDWIDPQLCGQLPTASQEVVSLRVFEQEVSATEDPLLWADACCSPSAARRLRRLRRVERCPGDSCGGAAEEWRQRGFKHDKKTMRLLPQVKLQTSYSPQTSPLGSSGGCREDCQRIRVEIRNPFCGASPLDGSPSILWAYEDRRFLWRVTVADDGMTLTLKGPPGAKCHYLAVGQIVEVLSTAAVLPGDLEEGGSPPGMLRCVAEATGFVTTLLTGYVSNADGSAGTVVLNSPLPPQYIRLYDGGTPLFLRAWQQEIPLNAGSSNQLTLTDAKDNFTGVSVQITVPSGGAFPHGAFWVIALRNSLQQMVSPALEPDGPKQWMCPLAVIDWTGQETNHSPPCGSPPPGPRVIHDCRETFRNLIELTKRKTGCCSVSLRPEDFHRDEMTLQWACDRFAGCAEGAVICLEPGTYSLTEPLRLHKCHSGLTIEACHGAATLRANPAGNQNGFLDGLVVLCDADNVSLERLTLELPPGTTPGVALKAIDPTDGKSLLANGLTASLTLVPEQALAVFQQFSAQICLRVQNCKHLTIKDCCLEMNSPASAALAIGVFLGGDCSGLTLQGSNFAGPRLPLASPVVPPPPLGTSVLTGCLMAPAFGLGTIATKNTPSLLCRAVLDGAAFRGNHFDGLTVAVLTLAESGAIRFQDNVVKDCFGGIWLNSFGATSAVDLPGLFGFYEVNFDQPTVIPQALRMAMFYAPPGQCDAQGGLSQPSGLARRFYLANNQIDALPRETGFSAYALLIRTVGDQGSQEALSSVLVSANELRAVWSHFAALIDGAASNSVTGNIILNLKAGMDSTYKTPFSLGLTVPNDSCIMAVTGNVLNCRSDLRTLPDPDPRQRRNIAQVTTGTQQQLQQLNYWEFLNSEYQGP